MRFLISVIVGLCSMAFSVAAQLAAKCSSIQPSGTEATAVCVQTYAAVMPLPFSRFLADSLDEVEADSFRLTSVPSDPSFQLVRNATFLVFDEAAGLDILGPSPSYEFVHESIPHTHELPVYVPPLNAIVYSVIAGDQSRQRLLDLNDAPPSVHEFVTDPPFLAVNGARFFNGSIWWTVISSTAFPDPRRSSSSNSSSDDDNDHDLVPQTPGIVRVDPATRHAEYALNNYFGSPLNSPDDLAVSRKTGDLFFTDPWYGYGLNFSDRPSPSPPLTYRFRPATGQVAVVDDSVAQPNGITLSPDESVLYITDTGLTDFGRAPRDGAVPRYGMNRATGRNVYAFDTRATPDGYELVNRRPFFLSEEYVEDGFHATAPQDPDDPQSYYLVGAAGAGVDIFNPYGRLLVRITAGFTVNNIEFAGENADGTNDLWLFGVGGIAKVTLNLKAIKEE